ncbi:Cof-type HAD-IIB family hydrolase [uncultured Lactobacillus sp.]|uniref:Cof-type HAD-IIB family hydrolase n=1 Tax=uncultured Lactobacillus sp. TaxID=153152 RepID=UPI00261C3F2F|nr:Cof-type HAD-IIB family hydrolase [uncultured Lactobacillus sp.]
MTAKIIFSDIDGTLINSDLQVTPKTRDAIRKQIMDGNLFVPVSARMPKAIMTAAGQITNSCPLIAYNGALVLDEMGKPLNSQFMKASTAAEICEFIEQQDGDTAWNVYSGYNWFSSLKPNSRVKREEEIVEVKSLPVSIDHIKELKGVHKVLLMGEANVLDKLKPVLEEKYPELYLVKSAPHLLEIMIKGVKKGVGVKVMAQAFDVAMKDTWAFGDNYNDEDMLEVVGHPVLMGNAPEDLKKKFSNVTLDNNHDGIAEALSKMS